MPILQFRRVYVPLILDGRKTQTIRARLGGGFAVGRSLRIQNGYSPTSHVADATISAVDEVPIAELTAHDAKLDGFPSLAELLTVIASTYPGAARVFRVRWRDLVPVAREATVAAMAPASWTLWDDCWELWSTDGTTWARIPLCDVDDEGAPVLLYLAGDPSKEQIGDEMIGATLDDAMALAEEWMRSRGMIGGGDVRRPPPADATARQAPDLGRRRAKRKRAPVRQARLI